jgi:murein DD-endopeptidase MepM/ murein hydrolase activator NlpD
VAIDDPARAAARPRPRPSSDGAPTAPDASRTAAGSKPPPRAPGGTPRGPAYRPSRQAFIATLIAVALAIVGSVAGIAIKQHKDPTSYQTVSVGKGGTDGLAGARDPLTSTTGAPVASNNQQKPATTVPVVAPLRNRVDPDVFLSSRTSLSTSQVKAVTRATGARRVLQVDFAEVKLGGGITTAIGVDPSTFRQYTPDNTAPVDALWQRVATGDAAVAHAVAAALQVKLGGHTSMGHGVQRDLRVGAFATSRLPGVGVVVDNSKSVTYGLVHNSALIMVLPTGTDPIVATNAAQQVLPKAKVQALRYAVQTGLSGGTSGNGGPGAPTVLGGVPILGNGWTLPLRLGSFTLTQRYHWPNGHPGIDLAAPWGTPIYAASEGDVLYWGPAEGFGNWIVLQHPGDVQTVYGHMRHDELLIGPTAHVRAGQLIARVGSEGNSTGPHLHFEVHIDNVRTDPIAFLNAHGVEQIH